MPTNWNNARCHQANRTHLVSKYCTWPNIIVYKHRKEGEGRSLAKYTGKCNRSSHPTFSSSGVVPQVSFTKGVFWGLSFFLNGVTKSWQHRYYLTEIAVFTQIITVKQTMWGKKVYEKFGWSLGFSLFFSIIWFPQFWSQYWRRVVRLAWDYVNILTSLFFLPVVLEIWTFAFVLTAVISVMRFILQLMI